VEKFVGMEEDELLKFQYKNAKKLGLADRAREKETRIREVFLDAHEDMFQFERFPRFRDPEEFAHASMQFWKRDELAANMLKWYALFIRLWQFKCLVASCLLKTRL
jgi:hypothetical protein